MPPLNSARAKLARASHHFGVLESEIPAFIRERRYGVVHETAWTLRGGGEIEFFYAGGLSAGLEHVNRCS